MPYTHIAMFRCRSANSQRKRALNFLQNLRRQVTTAISTFTLVVISSVNSVHAEAPKIKVGVLTSLTLDAAAYGTDTKNAAILFNELVSRNAYELLIEDEQSSVQGALRGYQKLVSLDGVKYIVGISLNSSLIALSQIALRNGTVLISPTSATGDIRVGSKGIFRVFQSDEHAIPPLYNLMARNGKRFAVVSEEDAYPETMARALKAQNSRLGNQLDLIFESVPLGTPDYRTLFTKLRAAKVDGFFVNSNGEDGYIRQVRQIREMKIEVPIYSAYFAPSEVVRKALGPLAVGARYVNLTSNSEMAKTPEAKKFLEEFKQRFGEPQSALPAVLMTAESMRLLHSALSSGTSVSEYLYKRKSTEDESYIGSYEFDDDGAAIGINYVTRVVEENGKDSDILAKKY